MSSIDELLDRWEDLQEQGQEISCEELCKDHPSLIEEVRWQIEALRAIDLNFGLNPSRENKSKPSSNADPHEITFRPPHNLHLASRYELKECYATGGIGQVYVAHDRILDRKVAIKFPKRHGMTKDQIARFEQEARITGKLDHPGVVPIHGLDRTETGEPCYVMRFVDGLTLQKSVEAEVAKHGGRMNRDYYQGDGVRRLLQSLVAVCNIAAFAHGKSIIHRDIKPNNILIGPFGETILLDWGIAKQLLSDREAHEPSDRPVAVNSQVAGPLPQAEARDASPVFTQPGRAMGTPAYASPEQIFDQIGKTGPCSDIYSLGATLYFILTSRAPLEEAGWSSYLQMVKTTETRLARMLPNTVPAALRAICDKALRINPDDRYQTATDMAQDLDRYLARESVSVLKDSWWTQLGRQARKRPSVAGAVLGSTLVIMIALASASTIIGKKNRDLRLGNENLAAALNDLEQANNVARSALRGMVDDIVALKFAQGETLSENDRNYIRSILDKYTMLADLQEDTEQSRIIRAEAHLQIGLLYYRLGQRQESTDALKNAIGLYEELSRNFNNHKGILDHVTALENLASIEVERGDARDCLATVDHAMEVATTVSNLTEDEIFIQDGNIASLHRLKAEALTLLNDSDSAVLELENSIATLDRMLAERPTNAGVLFANAQASRMIGNLLAMQPKKPDDLRAAQKHSDRAVDLLTKIAGENQGTPRYQMALLWAHADRSTVREKRGKLDEAIEDLWYAQSIAKSMESQYPLISVYKDCQPGIVFRRGRLYLASNRLEMAMTDVRNLSEGPLTPEQLDFAIHVFKLGLANEVKSDLDPVDTLRNLSTLLMTRGEARVEQGEDHSALEDYLSAGLHLRRLTELRPRTTMHKQTLVVDLIGIAKLHLRLQSPLEARQALRDAESIVTTLDKSDQAWSESVQSEINRLLDEASAAESTDSSHQEQE